MLCKITDNFYIDFEKILYVHKDGKDITMDFTDNNNACVNLSSRTKEGKEFIRKLNLYMDLEHEAHQ